MLNIQFNDLLGAPFKYGGTSIEEGFDCWTLVKELYRRNGIELPDYASDEDTQIIAARMSEGKKHYVELITPQPGCIVAFMIHYPFVSHVGVMLDAVRFVHILRQSSVCVERIDSLTWKKRVKGFYKYGK